MSDDETKLIRKSNNKRERKNGKWEEKVKKEKWESSD